MQSPSRKEGNMESYPFGWIIAQGPQGGFLEWTCLSGSTYSWKLGAEN